MKPTGRIDFAFDTGLVVCLRDDIEDGELNALEKSNIVPDHKKGDKYIVNNDRPVSLLPIFGRVFEKILFNSIFGYLQKNCLLCYSQAGF